MTLAERYHRNILMFGAEGQKKLRNTSVLVAGAGGLGSAIIQPLALLGVKSIASVDDEGLDETNRNRLIGARATDPIGMSKVLIADRNIKEINPDVDSIPLPYSIISEAAFEAVKAVDWVFGCFDGDGPRAILNELCAAYKKPYIDLASDVPEQTGYGGRVCVSLGNDRCLDCLDELDHDAVRRYFETADHLAQQNAIYGIDKMALEEKGPSVAPLNGVIASLAAMEFMVAVTGLRAPASLLRYRGHMSMVAVGRDSPRPDCHRCKGIWGKGSAAGIERYLEIPHLRRVKAS